MRVTAVIAGVIAYLLAFYWLEDKLPSLRRFVSFLFIITAIVLLASRGRRRS